MNSRSQIRLGTCPPKYAVLPPLRLGKGIYPGMTPGHPRLGDHVGMIWSRRLDCSWGFLVGGQIHPQPTPPRYSPNSAVALSKGLGTHRIHEIVPGVCGLDCTGRRSLCHQIHDCSWGVWFGLYGGVGVILATRSSSPRVDQGVTMCAETAQ